MKSPTKEIIVPGIIGVLTVIWLARRMNQSQSSDLADADILVTKG
jgi:hypothetical protein